MTLEIDVVEFNFLLEKFLNLPVKIVTQNAIFIQKSKIFFLKKLGRFDD